MSDVTLNWSEEAVRELEHLKTHYPNLKACVLPALWISQREYAGTLTDAAIAEVAYRLKRSAAEVQGVATFYSMYNTGHKVGKHMIEICTCLSCQICGGYRVLDLFEAKLGIKIGETTPDGQITLHEVECLNACDRAPVVQVGDQYHGPIDEAYIDRLIAELRANGESTVTQLANSIVKAQVGAHERA